MGSHRAFGPCYAGTTVRQTASILPAFGPGLLRVTQPFWIRRNNSMPVIVIVAGLNRLNPGIGLIRRPARSRCRKNRVAPVGTDATVQLELGEKFC